MDMNIRPRRLRNGVQLRKMVRETRMDKSSLIYPMFVKEGTGIREEIPTMPGQYRYSIDQLPYALEELAKAGVGSVMFFGIPDHKDACGSGAYAEDGIVQKAFREAKKRFPDLYCIGDVCMCEYTSHGHCGILHGEYVDNDKTLEYLAKIALSQVQAGADMVAPSDMMDGRVARLGNMSSKFGALYDSVLDRYSELMTFFGICYYLSVKDYFIYAIIAFVALIGSLMVSYVRARAEGLGIECKVGFMQRPERVVLTSLGALFCGVFKDITAFDPMLILMVPLTIVAVFANITAFARVRHCYKVMTANEKKND